MRWTAIDSEGARLLYAGFNGKKTIVLCATEALAREETALVFGLGGGHVAILEATNAMLREAAAAGATHAWNGREVLPLGARKARPMDDESRWASAAVHGVEVERVDTRLRCLSCPKGARKRVTHALMSNGLAMASGCEWHAYKLLRSMRQERLDT